MIYNMIFTNICIVTLWVYCLYLQVDLMTVWHESRWSSDRSDPIDCKASPQACASEIWVQKVREVRSQHVRTFVFFKVDVQLVRDCFVFQLPCFMLVLVSSRSTRIRSIPCMWGFSALPFQNLDGVTATGRRRFFWGNSSGRDPGSEEDKRKEAFLKAIACEPQSTRFPQKLQSCKLLSLPCV